MDLRDQLRRAPASKVDAFRRWLQSQGVEMLPPTNSYEVVRFRCKAGTGVVYRRTNGEHTVNHGLVIEAFDAYLHQKTWAGKGKGAKRKKGSKYKRALLDRDGDACFFCGTTMPGDDMTIEHLLSLCHGGPNRLENMVLAHELCNQRADNLPVIEKILMRERLHRGEELDPWQVS